MKLSSAFLTVAFSLSGVTALSIHPAPVTPAQLASIPSSCSSDCAAVQSSSCTSDSCICTPANAQSFEVCFACINQAEPSYGADVAWTQYVNACRSEGYNLGNVPLSLGGASPSTASSSYVASASASSSARSTAVGSSGASVPTVSSLHTATAAGATAASSVSAAASSLASSSATSGSSSTSAGIRVVLSSSLSLFSAVILVFLW